MVSAMNVISQPSQKNMKKAGVMGFFRDLSCFRFKFI